MRVAVVSGSRADYGLLRPTLAALAADPGFELCLLVTAMHLDPAYGDSLAEIQSDGHPIAARVPAGGPVRGPGDFARNVGHATVAFADALAELEPDVLVVLGDRFEILAAALAASDLAVPVAHIHGGELSEGSLDDAVRHCVTKLSHLHFVATRSYAERVCQLGENPAHVHVVGAAGPESIRRLRLLDRDALAATLGLRELRAPLLALTLHPESLRPGLAAEQTRAVTDAVEEVMRGAGSVVVTLPNDDPGNGAVREQLQAWSRTTAGVHVFATLGQLRYLSLLRHADAVVGNSSSAIIEAPSFGLPAVNVGERQHGRVMAANVLSCPPRREAVAAALGRALDPAFRASLVGLKNPYDHGDVARQVLAVLAASTLGELREKHFFDLADTPWRERLHVAPGGIRRGPADMAAPGNARRVVVVGAGGHARPVVEALRTSAAALEPAACTDRDPLRWGQTVDGVPIVGDDEALPGLLAEGVGAACIGVGGHGDNRPRARLHAYVAGVGFDLPPVVHGWAHVAPTASLGHASVVLAGAVVGAGARLGENVLVNSAATVEHDCVIGDHAHLASGCTLGGGVEIGPRAHVGLGAAILQGRRVGAGAIVGAGAVVVRDVAEGETVVGCPARAMEVTAHGQS